MRMGLIFKNFVPANVAAKRKRLMPNCQGLMAGGAQMFAFSNTTSVMRVGERNAQAAKELLAQHGIRLIAEDTLAELYG